MHVLAMVSSGKNTGQIIKYSAERGACWVEYKSKYYVCARYGHLMVELVEKVHNYNNTIMLLEISQV